MTFRVLYNLIIKTEKQGGTEMIEIIEQGTKQTKKCKACGCKFSFENVDIEHSTHSDFGNFSYDYVICPQCKEEIKLGGTK